MRFWARRIGFYVVTAWAAVTLNFLLPRMMPGGPVDAVMARFQGELPPSAAGAISAAFGLDPNRSMWSEYVTYLGNTMRGDFGLSFTYFPTPVSTVVGTALPWTIILLTIATLLGTAIGLGLGVVAGWLRGTAMDTIVPAAALLRGFPQFWIGLILVSVVAVGLGWFPASGGYSPSVAPGFTAEFLSDAAYHSMLPAATVVIGSVAGHMLLQRNMMVATLTEHYVLAAEAKGLRRRRVMLGYAARNAVLPSIAGFALELGFVVSGSLIVEKVFSYPGIGYVLYQAVSNQDYPLLQAILLVTTLAVLVANLLADLALFLVDPRTRIS
jgi:peptide/nickel transport system permease protein